MDTIKKDNLLTQQQLEEVTGGKINWGNGQGEGAKDTPEAVRFAFNVGDVVETKCLFHTERGCIISREVRYHIYFDSVGTGYYKPIYHVRLFKNGSISVCLQHEVSY